MPSGRLLNATLRDLTAQDIPRLPAVLRAESFVTIDQLGTPAR